MLAKGNYLATKQKVALQMWEPSRCIPYARNARIIPDSAVGKVAASINEFGFKQPIVVDAEGVIVAENTGRACYAMELSPAFVDVAVARWEAYTGESATLADGGATFADVAAQRESDGR